ncbi:MAG: hypothetical protein IJ471_01385 [Eubacterium sp.]|nr:hypothetical protein [Eubacterium sp.]
MSDLISRSALLQEFYLFTNFASSIWHWEDIERLINEQPKVYNVDAVVEQLENAREKEVVSMDKDRNITAVVQKEYIKIDRAIEIVRKGGVK